MLVKDHLAAGSWQGPTADGRSQPQGGPVVHPHCSQWSPTFNHTSTSDISPRSWHLASLHLLSLMEVPLNALAWTSLSNFTSIQADSAFYYFWLQHNIPKQCHCATFLQRLYFWLVLITWLQLYIVKQITIQKFAVLVIYLRKCPSLNLWIFFL